MAAAPRGTAAVVLAAGRGRRMGADKALLELGGVSAVERAVAACRDGGAETVVVVRAAGAAPLPPAVAATAEVVVVAAGAEMIDSLRAGLAACGSPRVLVVFPVDYPLVGAGSVRDLLAALPAAAAATVALPIHEGRPGHPIAVRGAALAAIADPAVTSLRAVVQAAEVAPVASAEPWVLRDLDTPEDLAAARAALRARPGLTATELMRSHRSRRAYAPVPIEAEQLEWLVDSARHASTSSFIQAYAVVAVADPERRREVARLCAGQGHIEQAPLFLAICADLHKLEHCCRQHDLTFDPGSLEGFVAATVDAALLGQNLILAAESEGLGGCMIGAARNHPVELAALLGLPNHVFVVFGLVLGKPTDDPVPRRRMPLGGVLFRERYDDAALPAALAGADAAMRDWAAATNARGGHAGRSVDASKGWSERMAAAWSAEKSRRGSRLLLRAALERLGFDLT